MSEPPLVSVLLVNYNGKHLLEQCLTSVRECLSVPHEVIVVDNASTDGSVDFLRERFPWVRLVAHHVNAGFTGGNNLAAAAALGNYLLLLNTDTIVRNSIDPIVESMESNARCGALGCRLSYADGRRQESIGHDLTLGRLMLSWLPLGRMLPRHRAARRTEPADAPIYGCDAAEVDWVSGAFLMTPRRLWNELGGLDESYFMYVEDVDYCKRVRAAGRTVLYSAKCDVTHLEGAGRSWIGERAVLNTATSYGVYFTKFHSPLERTCLGALMTIVFRLRSVAHNFAAMLGRDPDGRDKARAFAAAAQKMCGLAWTRRSAP
jgi:N-acetylglucosaminyl-diphospho-decaprenol L-rhamnosyltransferase